MLRSLVTALAFTCAAGQTNIADQIGQEAQLSTLNALLGTGDYDDIVAALSGDGTFTLFAPNNDALAGVDTSNTSFITNVLLYHALAVEVMAGDLSDTPVFPATLMTDPALVNKGDDVGQALQAVILNSTAMINAASVVTADISCTNGVIHIIDGLLLPPDLTSATAVAAGLTSLVDAVVDTDLVGVVDTTPSLTIFAPNNEAFAAAVLGAPLNDTLLWHVVPTIAYSTDLSDGMELTTAGGPTLRVRINGDGVFINNAKVQTANVLTNNAVVHVIEEVVQLDIASTIGQEPELATLNSLLASGDYPDIVAALSGPGNFTLFAPNNAAFVGVDASDVALITNVLLYHALAVEVEAGDLSETPVFAETLMTDPMYVNKGGAGQALQAVIVEGAAKINAATVVTADISCYNGVIHIIDMVLDLPNITSQTAVDAGLTALVDAVVEADLVDTVDNTPSLTIFAPTNEAFAKLGNMSLDDLDDLLLFHVVPSIAYSTDLSDGMKLTTAGGIVLTVHIVGDDVFINNAKVVAANVLTNNAVVHVIEDVVQLDIASRLSTLPEVATLNSILGTGNYSSIVDALSGQGNFTLFAPNNAAFDGVDASDIEFITNVLLYHALPVKVQASALSATPLFPNTLLADPAYVNKGDGVGQAVVAVVADGQAMINGAVVLITDIACSNGVIHVIDGVLLPPNATSVVAAAAGLDELVTAVVAADLVDTIDNTPSLTIFAPYDEAWANVPANLDLTDTLLYHVVPDVVAYSTDLSDGQQLTTAQGGVITVSISEDGSVMLDGANVLIANVLTKNAVVHVIDMVLDAPDPPAPTPAPSDGLSGGAIAGIVIACLVVVGGVAFFCKQKSDKNGYDYQRA